MLCCQFRQNGRIRGGHLSETTSLLRSRTTAPPMPVIDWARLLRCTECGARDADFVVTGNGGEWQASPHRGGTYLNTFR